MQVSWCKLEVEVTTPKSVMMASAEGQPQEVPPLVVAALNLKTRFNAQVPCSHICLPTSRKHSLLQQDHCLCTASASKTVSVSHCAML